MASWSRPDLDRELERRVSLSRGFPGFKVVFKPCLVSNYDAFHCHNSERSSVQSDTDFCHRDNRMAALSPPLPVRRDSTSSCEVEMLSVSIPMGAALRLHWFTLGQAAAAARPTSTASAPEQEVNTSVSWSQSVCTHTTSADISQCCANSYMLTAAALTAWLWRRGCPQELFCLCRQWWRSSRTSEPPWRSERRRTESSLWTEQYSWWRDESCTDSDTVRG